MCFRVFCAPYAHDYKRHADVFCFLVNLPCMFLPYFPISNKRFQRDKMYYVQLNMLGAARQPSDADSFTACLHTIDKVEIEPYI